MFSLNQPLYGIMYINRSVYGDDFRVIVVESARQSLLLMTIPFRKKERGAAQSRHSAYMPIIMRRERAVT